MSITLRPEAINQRVLKEMDRVFHDYSYRKDAVEPTTARLLLALNNYFIDHKENVMDELMLITFIQTAIKPEDPQKVNAVLSHIYYKALAKEYFVGSCFTRIGDSYIYHPKLTEFLRFMFILTALTSLVVVMFHFNIL